MFSFQMSTYLKVLLSCGDIHVVLVLPLIITVDVFGGSRESKSSYVMLLKIMVPNQNGHLIRCTSCMNKH